MFSPVTHNVTTFPLLLTPPTHLMCADAVVCLREEVLLGLLGSGQERWRGGLALQGGHDSEVIKDRHSPPLKIVLPRTVFFNLF